MRDKLCNESNLEKVIVANEKIILQRLSKIEQLEEDIKNGIQRYPRKNEEIIPDTRAGIFCKFEESIRAHYSLGYDCAELEELYTQAVVFLKDLNYNQVHYVNTLRFLALGILLEVSKEDFRVIVDMIDEAKLDDILCDYLVNAYGMKRTYNSTKFEKKRPYEDTQTIWEIAATDLVQATTKLEEYVQKNWLKGHADFGWTKAHKEVGYYGLWSFEAAAIAKILGLDDSRLKEDNHYPYDLAHYKNGMEFVKDFYAPQVNAQTNIQEEIYETGIPANEQLEQIIPLKFHKGIQQLLVDYEDLEDEAFWQKYELDELWYTLEEYQEEKADNGLLGMIIIDYLVGNDYVLQLDWKENIEDYIDNLENYWDGKETKIVQFELDNDQYYLARVPAECDLTQIYEVAIVE